MMKEDIKNIYTVHNLEELDKFSQLIAAQIFNSSYNIICLQGDLGAGKTQLVNFLLQKKINKTVSSPTFNILNIYNGNYGEKYLHFDLYRKSKITMDDLRELGLDLLYDDSRNRCFIEWPERMTENVIKNLQPALDIRIKKEDNVRNIIVRTL